MALRKTDVKKDDEVYLTVDCYPEVGAPGVPQQMLTVGVHKASDIPDFVWERGDVIAVPKKKEESSKADDKPAAKTTKASPTATESA